MQVLHHFHGQPFIIVLLNNIAINSESLFLGDYNYVSARRDFGVAVWNDAQIAAVCDAINAYRESLVLGSPIPRPAPNSDCPATFGNTDIFGGHYMP